MMNRIRLGILLMLLVPSLAAAQYATLGGTIVDDDGNPVGGVEITLTPDASLSSQPRRMKTKDDGRFRMGGLTPGLYRLSYKKEGHESGVGQDVPLHLGERTRLGDIVLPRLPDDWVDPDAQVHFDAGADASEAGDFEQAVESFLIVVDMAPDIPEVHYNLGVAYENLENMDKAVEHYERALEIRPGYYEPLIPISDYYTANKDWSRAAEYLKRATELRPNELSPQFNYGAVSMNAGDMEVAEAAFEKVLELDETRSMAHYQLGMIAVSQARNEEAIAHLEKYVELNPEGSQVAAAKGIIDTLQKQP